QKAPPQDINTVDTSSPSRRCAITREGEHEARPLSRSGRVRPAASAPRVHVRTQRAALPPPHPLVRHGVMEEAHRWGMLPCPLCLSTTRPRPATRVQASPPLLEHHWSLSARQRGSNSTVTQRVLDTRVALPSPTTLHCVPSFERNREG